MTTLAPSRLSFYRTSLVLCAGVRVVPGMPASHRAPYPWMEKQKALETVVHVVAQFQGT